MQKHEKVRRRLITARNYEEAARCLAEKLTDFGPSSTILNVLAFEIKLKALVLAYDGNLKFSHDYAEGWKRLSDPLQERLIEDAKKRFAGHVNFTDMPTILKNTERAFHKFRYDYEINETRTPQEIEAKSADWDNPDYEFHPLEIEGLNEAMDLELTNWLKAKK